MHRSLSSENSFQNPNSSWNENTAICQLVLQGTRTNMPCLSTPELECISSISESNQYSVRNWYMYYGPILRLWVRIQRPWQSNCRHVDTETCRKPAVALCKSVCMRGLVHLSNWQFIKIVHGSECNPYGSRTYRHAHVDTSDQHMGRLYVCSTVQASTLIDNWWHRWSYLHHSVQMQSLIVPRRCAWSQALSVTDTVLGNESTKWKLSRPESLISW